MPTITLDSDYTANFNCFRHGTGYVAKGVVHFRGKPRRVFEVAGATISAAEETAKLRAAEIWRELRAARETELKRTRQPKKGSS